MVSSATALVGEATVKRLGQSRAQSGANSPESMSSENIGTTVVRVRSVSKASNSTPSYVVANKEPPKLGPFKPMSYDEFYVSTSKDATAPAEGQRPPKKLNCQDYSLANGASTAFHCLGQSFINAQLFASDFHPRSLTSVSLQHQAAPQLPPRQRGTPLSPRIMASLLKPQNENCLSDF